MVEGTAIARSIFTDAAAHDVVMLPLSMPMASALIHASVARMSAVQLVDTVPCAMKDTVNV